MNRKCVVLAVTLLMALAASAHAFGSLVSSFRCPSGSTFPNGVAFLSNTVYIDTNTPDMCWETNTAGSLIRSFSSPTTGTMGTAVGSIGGTLYRWVVSYSPQLIYRCVATTGSVVNSFTAPGTYPYGVAFRDTSYLYYTESGTLRSLFLMHPTTGSIYASYGLSFDPNDLAYDPAGYLWIVDSAYIVRKCTLTGSTVDSFSVSSYGYAAGCGFGGNYVWVGFNAPLHSILQFTGGGTGVMPTSLGKVKTLFR
jgi:DNA-binding beta-propeller fold protein YncE